MAKSTLKKRFSMNSDSLIKDEEEDEGCSESKLPRFGTRDEDYEDVKPGILYFGSQDHDSVPVSPKRELVSSLDSSFASNSGSNTSTSNNVSKPVANVSSVARKMMEKMGHVEGKGLGLREQGISSAIETSKQKGRRGLGFSLSQVQVDEQYEWDGEKEKKYVQVIETITWMPESLDLPPLKDDLDCWPATGPKKMKIDDEIMFCDEKIVSTICKCKSVFDSLSGHELRKAVAMSNPFETIEKGIFQNRAAMKMANIDSVFDHMFTNPISKDGDQMIKDNNQLLYFADICAGPGGFTEYVLWKKSWHAKGFGFTLRGPNDFKLEEFFAANPESFEPHYGTDPADGDGDIYNPNNLIAFRNHVFNYTDNQGVHFVMADGGFSVEGQENLQEILSKRLYLCQFLCALGILREGGSFVCKLFDIFTPFSIGLIYIMYRCFDHVTIFKPNTSRPANSERYLICKWKKKGTADVENYLFFLNCQLDALQADKNGNTDLIQVVPLEILQRDKQFFDYVKNSNEQLGKRQIVFLSKVKSFAQDETLFEARQSELKNACFKAWKVPIRSRCAPPRIVPAEKFTQLMSSKTPNSDNKTPIKIHTAYDTPARELTKNNLKQIEFHHSFKCIMMSGEDPSKDNGPSAAIIPTRGLVIGMGKTNCYIWDGFGASPNFRKMDCKINLPPSTILLAESVFEFSGEGKAQKKVTSLHVLDGLFLGGEDIRAKPYDERMALAGKLVKSCHRALVPDMTSVRIRQLYDLPQVENVFRDLIYLRQMKSGGKIRLCADVDDKRYFDTTGLLIVPLVDTDKYFKCWSKSKEQFYYFEKKSGKSFFEIPKDGIASFDISLAQRLFWRWLPNGDNTREDEQVAPSKYPDMPDMLDRVTFRNFIHKLK